MTVVKKFRKKPVVIEAIQMPDADWWKDYRLIYDRGRLDRIRMIYQFIDDARALDETDRGIVIHTLAGSHLASPGDWIIKGVAGEVYPCKPDIFAMTYEEAIE